MSHVIQAIVSRLRVGLTAWTDPTPDMQGVEQRQQSRLITSMLLIMIVVGALFTLLLIPLSLVSDSPWIQIHFFLACVDLVTFLIGYYTSRRGNYRLAVHLLVFFGSITIASRGMLTGGELGMHILYYLAMVLVLSSLFLGVRATLLYFGLQMLILLLYPWLDPEVSLIEVIGGPLLFILSISTLAMLFGAYRRRLDAVLRSEIAKSEERYRIISEMISDYAFSFRVEPDGTQVTEWLTESFSRITGHDPIEFMSGPNMSLFHPEDMETAEHDLEIVLKGTDRSGEYRMVTKEGNERWFRLSRRPVWDPELNRVVRIYGVAQDITDQRYAEEQRLIMRLAEARFDLVNQFVRAVSHDFRTSLSIIETNRYLVHRMIEIGNMESAAARLDQISKQVIRLTRQLENLKVASSLTSPIKEASNLNQLVESVVSSQRYDIENKKLNINVHTDPTQPVVRTNTEQLQYAIGYLLENAISFTQEGGTITVRVDHDDDVTTVMIRDTGVGIEPEDLPHIFDFFFRADEARSIESGGIGLGLSIAKMIVEADGGTIRVYSEPGKGTTFTLLLPDSLQADAVTMVAD